MIVCPNCGLEGLFITLYSRSTQECKNCGYKRHWPQRICAICTKTTINLLMCHTCLELRYGTYYLVGDLDLTNNYCPYRVLNNGREV